MFYWKNIVSSKYQFVQSVTYAAEIPYMLNIDLSNFVWVAFKQ